MSSISRSSGGGRATAPGQVARTSAAAVQITCTDRQTASTIVVGRGDRHGQARGGRGSPERACEIIRARARGQGACQMKRRKRTGGFAPPKPTTTLAQIEAADPDAAKVLHGMIDMLVKDSLAVGMGQVLRIVGGAKRCRATFCELFDAGVLRFGHDRQRDEICALLWDPGRGEYKPFWP